MKNKKLKEFMKEFHDLQKKYEIYVYAGYEYEIDYDYDEESYISGVQSYLGFTDEKGIILTDSDGNEAIYDDELLCDEEEKED